MNAAADLLIAELETAAASPAAAGVIADVLGRVTARLEATDGPMTWEPIPLSVFGGALPAEIRSCWVFVLRPGIETGPERHPNSRQRSLSLAGAGEFEVREAGRWARHPLTSSATADRAGRWVSIPAGAWHRLRVGAEPWGMLSFHTVEARELIEEVPVDPDDIDGPTERHRYEGP